MYEIILFALKISPHLSWHLFEPTTSCRQQNKLVEHILIGSVDLLQTITLLMKLCEVIPVAFNCRRKIVDHMRTRVNAVTDYT